MLGNKLINLNINEYHTISGNQRTLFEEFILKRQNVDQSQFFG